MRPEARDTLLRRMYAAALAAADPAQILPAQLPPPPRGRTLLVAVGKAAWAMAAAAQAHWRGPLEGFVVVPAGTARPLPGLEVLEARHPIPDESSVAASHRILAAASALGPDDLLLALISGGGSALLAAPAPGVSLQQKQAITQALMRAGASIHELNVVRRHLSAIKGGRLAQAAAPAQVVTLAISDIPGDDISLIASGPTLPDPSTCADALAILDRRGIALPPALRRALEGGELESPKPAATDAVAGQARLIATAQHGLEAAAAVARAEGIATAILSDRLEGEAAVVAGVHAAIAGQVLRHGQPLPSPCVLLSGGETTVTVRGEGRGGRNTEFALAFLHAWDGSPGVSLLSAGTDGVDGNSEVAGALVDERTAAAAAGRLGLDIADYLRRNDSATALEQLDACLRTGPSGTNINDIRAVLIAP